MEILKYIEIFIIYITLGLGFISISLLFLLNRKFGNSLFKNLGLFIFFPQLSLTLSALVSPIMESGYDILVPWIGVDFLIHSASIFVIPILLYKILDIELPKNVMFFWLVLAILNMADFLRKSGIFFPMDWEDRDVTIVVTTLQFAWMLWVLTTHKDKIKIPALKSFFNVFYVITLIRIIYGAVDFVIYKFVPDLVFILYIFSFYICFLFSIYLAIIIFIARYFFSPQQRNPVKEYIPKSFIAIHRLTPREIDVSNLLIQGLTYKEIGESLFISHQTVKNYTSKLYQKLNVKSKLEFINLVHEHH